MHTRPPGARPSTWRTRCAWLVALALLWGVLAPQIARAFDGGAGRWIEVCTGLGVMQVQVPDDNAASGTNDSKKAATASDCPYCRLHTALGLALPPADIARTRTDVPRHGAPVCGDITRHALPSSWRIAQPRAPPSPTPT